MHPMLAEEIVKDVHKRIMEGDCKITDGVSNEMLEWVVAYLDKERAARDERIQELEQQLSVMAACKMQQQVRADHWEQQLKAAQAEVEHWKSVSKDCSDNYHAMRSEIEAAADTSRKFRAAQERLADVMSRLDTWADDLEDSQGEEFELQAAVQLIVPEMRTSLEEYFAKHSPSSAEKIQAAVDEIATWPEHKKGGQPSIRGRQP